MTSHTKKTISDIITHDQYSNWKNEVITITTGTGGGKSYFIKYKLSDYAKEQGRNLLLLVPRKRLKIQVDLELKKADINNIDVQTYQTFENYYKRHHRHKSLDMYDYIVCDEYHYFFSDAGFNVFTDLTLTNILDQKDKVVILMSATAAIVKEYINGVLEIETNDYYIKTSYDYIKAIEFYNNDNTLYEIIDVLIKQQKKAMFFIYSAEKAYELFKQYKQYSMFVCSENNTKFYKHVDTEAVNQMLVDEQFKCQFLFTTSVLDVGVNIIDRELNHIVIDMVDVDTFTQCLGRKRIVDENDHVNILSKAYSNSSMGGRLSKEKEKVKQGSLFRKEGVSAYIHKNYRKYNDLFYNNEEGMQCLNEMKYLKAIHNVATFETMLGHEFSYGYGYCINILEILGKYKEGMKLLIYEHMTAISSKEKYLDSLINMELLSKEAKDELISILGFKRNGKELSSVTSINEELSKMESNYRIVVERVRRNIEGQLKQIRIWKVIKHNN